MGTITKLETGLSARDMLAFVDELEGGERDLWRVAETGHYDLDCELGAALALRAVEYMKAQGDTHLLSDMLPYMMKRGVRGGIEIGFFAEIGKMLTGAEN